MADFDITFIDIAIAGIYIIIVLGVGLWISRSHSDTRSYFLGGRGAIWPVIGISMMSANLSGTSFVGLAGAGYGSGIAVWNYEWIATIVLVFFAVFVLPFYLRAKIDTMPQFLEIRYDRRSRKIFAAFTVVTSIFIDSAGALFAGALTMKLLFPDIPLWSLITFIAVLGGTYVILGGLKAVMVTDTIQGILLLVVGTVLFMMLYTHLGSWDAVRDIADEGELSIVQPADDDFMPWPGIFTGAIWLGFYYWTTNHIVVQKVLAAKSIDHGRWGALLAGALQLPFLFILILPGLMGRAIFPELEDQDQIWPALVFEFLPIGLRGLALAALIAALMSTLDSVLNGSASIVINDFIREKKSDWDEKKMLFASRVLVGVFMVIAAVWAPMIAGFGGIVEYFQSFLGYVTMPVVVVFLGGLFWKRPPRHAAFWTLSIVAPIGFASFFAFEVFELVDIQFLYGTGIMLALSLAIFLTITLRSVAPELEKGTTFGADTWHAETRELADKKWFQNHRILGAALVLVTIVMVVIFI